jgi:hypothetical protein
MNLNKHLGIPFANGALLVLMFSMLASSVLLSSYGAAMALVGWALGLWAAAQRRHWRWLVFMLGVALALLLCILTSESNTIQFLLFHLAFTSAALRQLFLPMLAGFVLIPTVLYASSDALEASTPDSPFSRDHRPDIISIGLVLLGLFFVLLFLRFVLAGLTLVVDV